ncbi:hypothetical protein ACI784_10040 [Geodermatophilus sp. SYSU D01186]
MTTPGPDEDDRLLDLIGQAVRSVGPIPPAARAAGEAAWSWRTVDAELAALTHDSTAGEPVLQRSAPTTPRTLVFEGGGLAVELSVTEEGLVGQLVPPTEGEVTLLSRAGVLDHTTVDEVGCFTFDEPAGGEVQLRCGTSSGVLRTDWFSL